MFMFNCQLCGRTVPLHTPVQRVVLETRPKSYPPRENIYPPVPAEGAKGSRKNRSKKARSARLKRNDPGGQGSEIVREVLSCAECALRYGP
ncbi:hypothetical protein GCM10008957_36160 [Deinococcus ruber]|uniref:Uncharacterized protein n=1 Tax=Deinococcus ruber TaxID=1848197 RepID=A0A918CEL6_9DEIO|nr:hypothetical protein GCM10008957_36160 [Deinococcus ruber]